MANYEISNEFEGTLARLFCLKEQFLYMTHMKKSIQIMKSKGNNNTHKM